MCAGVGPAPHFMIMGRIDMNRIHRGSLAALVVSPLCLAIGLPAHADAVVQGAVYQYGDYTNPGGTQQNLYNSPINVGSPVSQTVNWNYTCDVVSCPGYGLTATGASKVINGSLGAQSSLSLSAAPAGLPNYMAEANSYAQYTDNLTITGGTGSGVLKLQYTVDGSAGGGSPTSSVIYGGGYAYVGIFGAAGVSYSLNNGAITNSSVAYINGAGANKSDTVTFYVPFTYGTAFSIEPILKTTAQFLAYEPTPFATNWDYYNTAALDSVLVLDGTPSNPGSTVGTASIASTSGLGYTPTGISSVPAPATWLLFGAGLVPLVMVKRRRPANTAE